MFEIHLKLSSARQSGSMTDPNVFERSIVEGTAFSQGRTPLVPKFNIGLYSFSTVRLEAISAIEIGYFLEEGCHPAHAQSPLQIPHNIPRIAAKYFIATLSPRTTFKYFDGGNIY